jgi:uncharacterized protein (TIGR00255 family)
VLSMTGYGIGTASLGRGKLIIEARGVNHRYLDVHIRLPAEIVEYAYFSDRIVRKLAERGKVEINGRIEGQIGDDLELNIERAKHAFLALVELRDMLSPSEPVPLSILASVPDLFTLRNSPETEDVRRAVVSATEQACVELGKMRASEGASLAADLTQRVEFVRRHIEAVRTRFPELVATYQRKLRVRVEKLLSDTDWTVEPGRLEHEVALFADRSDVTEEVTRMLSHCDQFAAMIDPESAVPVGRRLEFLLQEMVREVNTIGSKISDVAVTHLIVELKAELERLREQVQNVL